MGVILLKLINNGLTLAQLNTFWQMVVTGGIILVAVGIDIVRQSRDPAAVRKLLAAVGAFMAFLSLMTPASQWLGAQISMLEHARATALREAGQALAPGHTARLLDPAAIDAAQATAAANLPAALALLVLAVLAGLNIFARSDRASLGLAVLFLAAIPLLVMLGYHVSTPFLVLGALVLAASAFVFAIFERARRVAADG